VPSSSLPSFSSLPFFFFLNPESPTLNPLFLQQQQQDHLLVAWLFASMTMPILTKMVGLCTTHQKWTKLHTYYATQSRAKIKKLKVQLRNPEKDPSISTYLLDEKKIVDTLVVVGAPILIDDQIKAILDDLLDEYDGFITFVTSRINPYTVEDIEALLLTQEEHFDKHCLLDSSIVQAHLSTASLPTSNPTSTKPWMNQNHKGGRRGGRPLNRFSRGSNRITGNRNPNFEIQCQIYGKMGTSALCCWQRYDTYSNKSVNANATDFFTSINESVEPSILGAPSTVTNPLWYPDNGATHHLTSDFNAFTTKSNYNGFEDVKLGNGLGTPIAHIVSTTYVTPYNNTVIHLNQLFHVPNIIKNLTGVFKFAQDSNVFFEFYFD